MQPALNPAQEKIFLRWSSYLHVNPNAVVFKPEQLEPTDIIQDVVTDCSLIASFAVAINHSNKYFSKVEYLYYDSTLGRARLIHL